MLENVAILQDADRLLAIMKDGSFHKRFEGRAVQATQAAE